MSTFSDEKALQENENRVLCHPIMTHGGESLDEENRNVGIARYSPTKELLSEYIKIYSRRCAVQDERQS